MKCPECGAELRDDVVFCTRCGKKIVAVDNAINNDVKNVIRAENGNDINRLKKKSLGEKTDEVTKEETPAYDLNKQQDESKNISDPALNGDKIDAPKVDRKVITIIAAAVAAVVLIGGISFAIYTISKSHKELAAKEEELAAAQAEAEEQEKLADEAEAALNDTGNDVSEEDPASAGSTDINYVAEYTQYISSIGKGDPAAYSFMAGNDPADPVCIALWLDGACMLAMNDGKISESWINTPEGIAQVTSNYRMFETMDEAWSVYSEATAGGKYPSYSEGIHRYEFVTRDCTWDEAAVACHEAGGHLVTFETEEEFEHVTSQINHDIQRPIYIIGSKCTDGQYHWFSPMGINTASNLNESSHWLNGEPSFSDGTNTEDRVIMFYKKDENRWVWIDVPNDILAVAPNYSGELGYICEYE